MVDYFLCIILIILSTFFYYFLGKVLEKQEHDFSYRYVTGYFVFTFFAAVPGIFVQVFGVPWKIYCFYYLILILLLCLFIFKKLGINKLMKKDEVISIVKENYFLVIVSVSVLLISFLYVWLFWANNHSDDGFYIGRIAEYPYLSEPFFTNVVNGFSEKNLSTYSVNTWELEASVFVYLFKINPVIFVRFYLSLTNIFLCVNVIKGLSVQILKMFNKNIYELKYKYTAQFITLVILLFSFNSSFFEQTGLIETNDLWQFNGGMYLGSSIVRVIGLPILLMYFIDRNSFKRNDIIWAIILSVSLISKSTIALPLLVIFALVYIILEFPQRFKHSVFVRVNLIICLFILSIFLSNNVDIENVLRDYLFNNLKSPLILTTIVILCLSMFFKKKEITRLNLIILLIAFLMFVNPINNIFESSSIYTFVAGRMNTNYIYTLMIVATIYVYLFTTTWINSKMIINLLSGICFILLVFSSYMSFSLITGTLKDSYNVLYRNKELIPKSTMALSKTLNELSKEKELYVICPSLPVVNGRLHTAAVNLRFWAPDIKVVTNLIRYPTNTEETRMYRNYNQETQNLFDEFSVYPNDLNSEVLDIILSMGGINCIVVESEQAERYMLENGFSLHETVEDIVNNKKYYIYVN